MIFLIEMEVQFQEPVAWIKDLVKTHSASIRIRDIRKGPEGVKDLIEIFLPFGKAEEFSSELRKSNLIDRYGMTVVDDTHATAIISAQECTLCQNIMNWDLFLIEAYSNDNGDITMKWLVPDEESGKKFLDRLITDGVRLKLLRKKTLSKRSDITSRQEFVVRTALNLGFFEYPKKINLEGLSERLNVSYVTLAEILRRAEKNIISSYFNKK